jgi:hypothetical protein
MGKNKAVLPALKQLSDQLARLIILRGGTGSGNFNHAGCPGKVGGSCKPGAGGDEFAFAREPFKNKFKYYKGSTQTSVEDTIKKIFGAGVTMEDLAHAAGALPQAKIEIGADPKFNEVLVYWKSGDAWALRAFRKAPDGPYMENVKFVVTDTGKGLGTRIFAKQVYEAGKLGCKEITASADREEARAGRIAVNGYYTWPRLGFDTDLKNIDTISVDKKLAKAIKEKFPDANKLSDLMKTQEGRNFWKAEGEGFKGTFDLTPNSTSRKVLFAYLKETGVVED